MNLILRIVISFFGVLMTLRTISKGWDFEVFWRVSRDFIEFGTSPYDLARYGNMVFKYPPWILPFFLPFALFPLAIAKALWGVLQALSLYSVVRSTRSRVRAGNDRVLAGALVLFAGIWIVHGIVGQTSLLMLALALELPRALQSRASIAGAGAIAAITGLSAKILTVFPLLFFVRERRFWKMIAVSILAFTLLSLPIWLVSYGPQHVVQLLQDWIASNFSGTQAVGQVRIGFTTREAQGFPSLILRAFSWDENVRSNVILALLASLVGVAGFATWAVRKLPTDARWWVWIALTPTVQPLAWFHFFSFAYPLLVWVWISSPTPGKKIAVGLAGIMIAAITEKTLGPVGHAMEMASIKSWGVLFLVLIATRPRPGALSDAAT